MATMESGKRSAAGASPSTPHPYEASTCAVMILSSSDSESDESGRAPKRLRYCGAAVTVKDEEGKSGTRSFEVAAPPGGFLDPVKAVAPLRAMPITAMVPASSSPVTPSCKQFWKAGDYQVVPDESNSSLLGGMDHVRVHPKFLHSNATSHKWALGAVAELLDNAMDEVCNGATYVKIDMLQNQKDGSEMLLFQDDGGGMDPGKLRQCMSLGYSEKSKSANTIGQYGNGFKTSTMRLGADVIVFTRCHGEGSPTQSIGMLSYTFLRSTGKEDIMVPMIDYEKEGQNWKRMERSCSSWCNQNLETILQWSPYMDEEDLLQQFSSIGDKGTRIIIYNLWEDDEGQLELDFDVDHDIQIRGVNRDEKKIQMANRFPNSKHFLTYHHSLRSYASILYLKLPPGFRIILRGKDIEHHNIVEDMMLKEEQAYRPRGDRISRDTNMVAVVTVGFVKDAKDHIDVQGFNVYHKNRLIKPFWRLWNPAGSDGRGVIGVLEANFVEPAHDKQGFERTTVLSRLEAQLIKMQKSYWSSNCHKIGYAPRRNKKSVTESTFSDISRHTNVNNISGSNENSRHSNVTNLSGSNENSIHTNVNNISGINENSRKSKEPLHPLRNSPPTLQSPNNGSVPPSNVGSNAKIGGSWGDDVKMNDDDYRLLKIRLKIMEEAFHELQFETDKNYKLQSDEKNLLSEKLKVAEERLQEKEGCNKILSLEKQILAEEIEILSEENQILKKKLEEARAAIQVLLSKSNNSKNVKLEKQDV